MSDEFTRICRRYDAWNRCDVCGQFIPMRDFESGAAKRELIMPDSDRSREEWETVCSKHNEFRAAP